MLFSDVQKQEKGYAWLFLLVLAAVCSDFVVMVLFSDIRTLLITIPDDASYYFKIADTIVHNAFVSFDGIHETNGFQPLWLCMLLPVAAVFKGSPEAMMQATALLQVVLLAVSALMLFSLLSKTHSVRSGFFCSLLFFAAVFFPGVNGMESALLICMCVVLLYYGRRSDIIARSTPRGEFFFGILLGLVMLTRLDMVFLGGVIAAVLAFDVCLSRRPKRETIRRFVTVVGSASLIVAPYLLLNYLFFGHAVPISGILKSCFPHPMVNRNILELFTPRYTVCILIACCYLGWLLLSGGKRRERSSDVQYFGIATAVCATSVVLHALYTFLFMKWAVFAWHFILYPFCVVLIIGDVFYRLGQPRPKGVLKICCWIIAGLIVCAACVKVYRRHTRPLENSWHVASYNAACWARENTQPDSVFAMKDAGHFSFFSRRKVINLDGIVNNLQYQDVLKEKNLKKYFADNNVMYLVQHAFWNNESIATAQYDVISISYWSHLYSVESVKIPLYKQNEAYRSPVYYDGPYASVFVIWKL